MAQELTLKCAGLYTDPNPLNEIPAGAMRQAENIQIRRLGSAEQRPLFTGGDVQPGVVEAIISYASAYTNLRDDGTQHWENGDYDEILPLNANLFEGLTVAITAASSTVVVTGDQDALDGLLAVIDWKTSGFAFIISGGEATYPGEATTALDYYTRVSNAVPTAGTLTLTLTKPALDNGTSFVGWQYALQGGFTTVGVTSSGATELVLDYDPISDGGGYIHPGILTDSGFVPGQTGTTYFSAGTEVTYFTQSPTATFQISLPTLTSVPDSTSTSLYSIGLSAHVGLAQPGEQIAYVVGETSWADMQRRLYVTLADVLARYEGGIVYSPAGMPQPGQARLTPTQDTDDGFIGVGDQVAYRIVLGREVNTQLLLSAPSAPSFLEPTSDWVTDDTGTPVFTVLLEGRLPPGALEGDLLQVYRTEVADVLTNPSTPGDEMRLLTTVVLGPTEIATREWSYTDLTPNAGLTGASLYTNETQQGILAANAQPPRVGCVATYADMLFGGNVSLGHETTLNVVGARISGDFDYTDPQRLWPALQLLSGSIAVTVTASTNTITITGNTSTVEVAVNDFICDPGGDIWDTGGTYFANATQVTNVVTVAGTMTITLNQNTLAFGGGPVTSFGWVRCLQGTIKFYGSTPAGALTLNSDLYWSGWAQSPIYLSIQGSAIDVDGGAFLARTVATATGAFPDSGVVYTLNQVTQTVVQEVTLFDFYRFYEGEEPVEVGGSGASIITVTNGSPVIDVQGTAATYAFTPGQQLTDYLGTPGGPELTIPIGTEIESINDLGGAHIEITMTNNATANDDGFGVYDWIAFNGNRMYPVSKQTADDYPGPAGFIPGYYFIYGPSELWSFQNLGYQWGYANPGDSDLQAVGAGSESRALLISSTSYPGWEYEITSSKPASFAREVGPDTGVSTEVADYPNRLVWSKTQEPDAMPLPYFVDIGSAGSAILRVLPTRDSLFVFKQDGTWRVSGYSPESLRVDEYDRTLRLMQPNALSQVDNNLIGWFTSGVMQVTDATTNNLSDNMIGGELESLADLPSLPGAHWPGTWAFSAERDNEWVLIPGNEGTPLNLLYVFNFVTGAWVKWTLANGAIAYCGIDLEGLGRLAIGGMHTNPAGNDYSILWKETSGGAEGPTFSLGSTDITRLDPFGSDGWYQYLLVVSDPGGSTLPTAGDRIFCLSPAQTYTVVSAVDTGTEYEITAVGPDIGADSTTSVIGTWSLTPEIVLEWTAKTAQNAGKRKYWREVNFAFSEFRQNPAPQLGFRTEQISGVELSSATPADRAVAGSTITEPYFLRALIPRATGRAVWLNPSINLSGGYATWRLEACNLVYNWMGART